MGRRKGQSWWNYIGNSIPIIKALVPGENYQDYGSGAYGASGSKGLTGLGLNAGYNLNSMNNPGQPSGGGFLGKAAPYIMTSLGAAGNIIGASINSKAQRDINEQQIAWAIQNYNMSREDAIAFWHMQNEYNTPSNQRKLFEEAGLNPHLLFGHGTTAAKAGDISSPQYQTPDLKSSRPGDAITGLSDVLSAQMMQAQIENIKANTASTQESTKASSFENAVRQFVGFENEGLARQWQNYGTITKNRKQEIEFEAWARLMLDDEDNVQRTPNDPRTRLYKDLLRQYKQGFIDNDIKSSISAVERFKAELARSGLSPDTPWYYKLLDNFIKKLTGNSAMDGAMNLFKYLPNMLK